MSHALNISADLALPLDVAGEAIGILATRGAGKSYTSAVLIAELHKAGIQTVVVDPAGVYWGLRSSAKGTGDGLPIIVLGGVHGDVPLEATAGKLIADLIVDTGQSLILDLSDFDSDTAQARFMGEFSERLYRRKARSRTTLHLVVDEADEFAPQKPQKGEEKMLHSMVRLVRRGRSRGIGLTLITQRSASISKNALDLVETLVIMRMLGPRDRDAISGWIQTKRLNDELGVLESLPSLPTGTAWVWSPLRGILKKAAIRRIETFDSYATPKPGEARIEPRALADVNLEKLGEQIKATVERAKQDDPKALRARIAELERAADQAGASPAELAAAEQRGYERGHAEGLRVRDECVSNLVRELDGARDEVGARIGAARSMLTTWLANTAAPAAPVTAAAPAPRLAAPRAARIVNGPGQSMPKAERQLLIVMAQRHPRVCTRSQLSILSGYSITSSSFANALGALRLNGYSEGYGDDNRITEAGIAALGSYEPLPTGHALVQWWLSRLSKAERTFLGYIVQRHPHVVTKEELSTATGYSLTSSSFANALGKLRTLELISGRGELRASEELFG